MELTIVISVVVIVFVLVSNSIYKALKGESSQAGCANCKHANKCSSVKKDT